MGVPTLTAAIEVDPGGILYWNGSKLAVGQWGTVNNANAIYAKFGSVVGFTCTGYGDDWDATDIKFDPRTTKTTTWAGINYWNGSHYSEGYISSSDYHNGPNVQAGRGDICKLVGYTATQANGGNINGEWRLPTTLENAAFIGDHTKYRWIGGTPPFAYFSTGYSLPALGLRTGDEGATSGYVSHGAYWSSTPSDQGGGFNLDFAYNYVRSTDIDIPNSGFAIRCVRQTP